jgi:hypothetical protein
MRRCWSGRAISVLLLVTFGRPAGRAALPASLQHRLRGIAATGLDRRRHRLDHRARSASSGCGPIRCSGLATIILAAGRGLGDRYAAYAVGKRRRAEAGTAHQPEQDLVRAARRGAGRHAGRAGLLDPACFGSAWRLALLSGGLAVVEQIGDIAESYAKRRFGVKDSGNLIPGTWRPARSARRHAGGHCRGRHCSVVVTGGSVLTWR